MDASSNGIAERKSTNGGREVVINVSGEEASRVSFKMDSPETKSSSPEISKLISSPNKPPRPPNPSIEGLTQRKSFARSVYSKPKSRFVEPSYPVTTSNLEGDVKEPLGSVISISRGSPNNKSTRSVGSATPNKATEVEKDEDEEIYKKVKLSKEMRRRVSPLTLVELAFFIAVLSSLVASLTIDVLITYTVWGLEVWKWCVLVMVTFSGMLVTNWFMHLVVFLIETNFLLRRKVLYFVHGLKKSVQVFIWLSLILIAWVFLFNRDVDRSPTATKILTAITRTLISLLTGAFLWLVKTLLLKILAANFNVVNFFDRIQESVFHQYVLQTLSGPPLMEEAERVGREWDLDAAVSTFLDTDATAAAAAAADDLPAGPNPSLPPPSIPAASPHSPDYSPSESSPSRSRSPSPPSRDAPYRLRSKAAAASANQGAGGNPSGSRTTRSRQQAGNIRTFADLNRSPADGADSDSDEGQEYYTGGQRR